MYRDTEKKLNELNSLLKNIINDDSIKVKSDEINGKTFAVVRYTSDVGTYENLSSYMSFDNFNSFLFGFQACKNNHFKLK